MDMEPSQSSGSLAVGTTTVVSRNSVLLAVILNPGSAAGSVSVTDGSGGKVLASLVAPASGASVVWLLDSGVQALTGLTAVVAGTGATAVLSYKLI